MLLLPPDPGRQEYLAERRTRAITDPQPPDLEVVDGQSADPRPSDCESPNAQSPDRKPTDGGGSHGQCSHGEGSARLRASLSLQPKKTIRETPGHRRQRYRGSNLSA